MQRKNDLSNTFYSKSLKLQAGTLMQEIKFVVMEHKLLEILDKSIKLALFGFFEYSVPKPGIRLDNYCH